MPRISDYPKTIAISRHWKSVGPFVIARTCQTSTFRHKVGQGNNTVRLRSTHSSLLATMAPITLPGYGEIEPLSAQAEVLVKSDDPEHVSTGR